MPLNTSDQLIDLLFLLKIKAIPMRTKIPNKPLRIVVISKPDWMAGYN